MTIRIRTEHVERPYFKTAKKVVWKIVGTDGSTPTYDVFATPEEAQEYLEGTMMDGDYNILPIRLVDKSIR